MVYALSFGEALELGNGHCSHRQGWSHQRNEHTPAAELHASLFQVLGDQLGTC